MLSKSAARWFFVIGTVVCFGAFILLTIDSIQKVPAQTNFDDMSASVIRGKHLFDKNNCMGCHTVLGEGGYYAPELTKVYERRGPAFIKAMLNDPQQMYPGERKMVDYDFNEQQLNDFVAFFKWVNNMDLNGFPPEPDLAQIAVPAKKGESSIALSTNRPKVFNQMCISCHSLQGQGGNVGPALDEVGKKMSEMEFREWLDDPQKVRPGTMMPDLPLTEAQIRELSAFLVQLNGNEGEY